MKSIRIAQNLISRGITSEDIIVLCAGNGLDSCLPFLACLYLGVKVSPVHPSQCVEDLSYMLHIVKPRFVFCEEGCETKIEKVLKMIDLDCNIVVIGETEKHIKFSEFLIETKTEGIFEAKSVENMFDTAAILFSSGTSGKPKGICTTYYGLVPKVM